MDMDPHTAPVGDSFSGRALGQGRVYQASGDQHITEHHHHDGPLASPLA